MPVVGSDGGRVGTVDKLEEDRAKSLATMTGGSSPAPGMGGMSAG